MHPPHLLVFQARRLRVTLAALALAVAITGSAPFPDAAARSNPNCSAVYLGGISPTLSNAKLRNGSRSLCFNAFALSHSALTRTPLYVAERLTRASIDAAEAYDTRDNRFHPEMRLSPSDRAELADYRGSGYDRGHMAPSGDMSNPAADFESFSLANIVPQDGQLNRGGWADLEGYVRDLAGELGETYVVTGPAFVGGSIRRLNARVLVPSHVWKAVYVPGQGAGAWIASNDAAARWEVVSIATLAARTGIDPFPRLSAAARTQVPAFPTF